MRVDGVLAERDHVIVGLDGPVAEGLAVGSVAGRLRVLLSEDRLPWKVRRTEDPLVVVAHAGVIGPATERAVRAQWRRLDHEVVAAAEVAVGVREAFAALAAYGARITVVGALDVAAMRIFLNLNGLDEHVGRLVGRAEGDRALLPPAPDLITAAVHAGALPVGSCVFVGGSDHDLAAARAAGVDTIRHRRADPDPVTPTNAWLDLLAAPTRR